MLPNKRTATSFDSVAIVDLMVIAAVDANLHCSAPTFYTKILTYLLKTY
jgi:hypothetical protein